MSRFRSSLCSHQFWRDSRLLRRSGDTPRRRARAVCLSSDEIHERAAGTRSTLLCPICSESDCAIFVPSGAPSAGLTESAERPISSTSPLGMRCVRPTLPIAKAPRCSRSAIPHLVMGEFTKVYRLSITVVMMDIDMNIRLNAYRRPEKRLVSSRRQLTPLHANL